MYVIYIYNIVYISRDHIGDHWIQHFPFDISDCNPSWQKIRSPICWSSHGIFSIARLENVHISYIPIGHNPETWVKYELYVVHIPQEWLIDRGNAAQRGMWK